MRNRVRYRESFKFIDGSGIVYVFLCYYSKAYRCYCWSVSPSPVTRLGKEEEARRVAKYLRTNYEVL